jgi:GTP-binding protein
VNKLDSLQEEDKLADFFRLGEEDIIPISAEHKRNLTLLKEKILMILPEDSPKKEEIQALKIALVGRINVGKSSIVNKLCGEEKLIVSEIPGTTRDSTDTLIYRNKRAFCLVDTAGIRKLSRTKDKREIAGILKAKKDIRRADVVCMILDAQEFPTRQDTAIGHLAEESGKPLLLVLNKWDLIPEEVKNSDIFKEKSFHKLQFISYAPIITISALSGKRVVKILDMAETVYEAGSMKIATSRLNKFLAWVNENHPPISKKKRKIKIKYISQAAVFPPTFILFTHSKTPLSPSYKKHFIHLLREHFGFSGTPIRLILKKN